MKPRQQTLSGRRARGVQVRGDQVGDPASARRLRVRIPGMHTRVAMSIKYGLLALLERGTLYGYQLRAEFEESTGGDLAAEHRAGLHDPVAAGTRRAGAVAAGARRGAAAVRDHRRGPGASSPLWFATPIGRGDRPRDELAIKLALALTTPGVDVRGVVQTQRTATMRMLQEYTRLKHRAGEPGRPRLAARARRR